MRNSFFVLMIVLAFTACSGNLRTELNQSLNDYNNLLRWNEWDTASTFVADSLREDFITRAKAAKNVRVVDCRLAGTRYDKATRQVSAEVEIDYYLLTSSRVKTLRDTEVWVYRPERGAKGWKLISPFPVLK